MKKVPRDVAVGNLVVVVFHNLVLSDLKDEIVNVLSLLANEAGTRRLMVSACLVSVQSPVNELDLRLMLILVDCSDNFWKTKADVHQLHMLVLCLCRPARHWNH